jgi:NAD(P)H-flavin reductase
VPTSTPRLATEVLRVAPACANASHVRVDLRRPEGFVHGPGQVLDLARGGGTPAYYAIASAPDEAALTLLVRADASAAPFTPGEAVSIGGPWGAGFTACRGGAFPERLVLCAIGSAVGAVRSAWREALSAGLDAPRLELRLGVRVADALPFADELDALAAHGAAVTVAVSRGELASLESAKSGVRYVSGRVQTSLIAAPLGGARGCVARLAGNPEAEDAMTAALLAAGVDLGAIERNYSPDQRATR